MGYIQGLLDAGKRFFLLRDNAAIAVVAVQESVISDLYVHPEQQRNGYGTLLLSHAIKQCEGIPTLWVLNINRDAKRLYERMGFAESGRIKQLKNNLFEIEMIYQKG